MATDYSTKESASASLTLKIINPLVEAVGETFSAMLNAEVQRTSFDLRPENAENYDYSALIGVSGTAQGSFCLSLTTDTATKAVSRFTGLDLDQSKKILSDGVGEFTNVIVGSAKSKLTIPLNLGIPNVIHGNEYQVDFPPEAKPMRVEFDSDLGPLLIDFGFVQSSLK